MGKNLHVIFCFRFFFISVSYFLSLPAYASRSSHTRIYFGRRCLIRSSATNDQLKLLKIIVLEIKRLIALFCVLYINRNQSIFGVRKREEKPAKQMNIN